MCAIDGAMWDVTHSGDRSKWCSRWLKKMCELPYQQAHGGLFSSLLDGFWGHFPGFSSSLFPLSVGSSPVCGVMKTLAKYKNYRSIRAILLHGVPFTVGLLKLRNNFLVATSLTFS